MDRIDDIQSQVSKLALVTGIDSKTTNDPRGNVGYDSLTVDVDVAALTRKLLDTIREMDMYLQSLGDVVVLNKNKELVGGSTGGSVNAAGCGGIGYGDNSGHRDAHATIVGAPGSVLAYEKPSMELRRLQDRLDTNTLVLKQVLHAVAQYESEFRELKESQVKAIYKT